MLEVGSADARETLSYNPRINSLYTFREFIFCTILLWTLTLRAVYISPHGGDTWSHLVRANNITENGYVGWFIHPLSFFGWYSFSYPSGVHVLMSALIQILGFEPNFAVLFFSAHRIRVVSGSMVPWPSLIVMQPVTGSRGAKRA